MKRLSVLFLGLFILAAGLFANPTVPIVKDYLKSKKSNSEEECLVFINNSCQNIYRILAEVTDHATLWVTNESLVTHTEIVFAINFTNQAAMESFTNLYVDSYDLEKVFLNIRNSAINSEITPLFIEDEKNNIKEVLYLLTL